MRQARRTHQEGVALVTVLMIIAAMSVVAIALSSAVLSSTNRAKSLDASAQIDWMTHAAEEYARVSIADLVLATENRLVAGMPGLNTPLVFDAEGGIISLTVRDGTNCFNLNSLRMPLGQSSSDGDERGARSSRTPVDDFIELVEEAGIEQIDGDALAASLADWMDADQTPGLSGAEDSYYATPSLNYRTAGQPMAEVEEALAVRHMSAELLDALDPLVCTLPEDGQHALNINTLTEGQAPLLSLAMSGALSAEGARDLIFQRPLTGWASIEDFMALPAIAEIAPELRREDMLSLQSAYIDVSAAIEYRGTRRLFDLVYALEGAQLARTVHRERKG